MLCRLSLLAICATTLAAASSDSAVVVERGLSPVAAFPANLARRFTSTVGFLRSRGRAFVKDDEAIVQRSISDELVAMLKGASSLGPHPRFGRSSGLILCHSAGLSQRKNASPSASAAWAEPTEDAAAAAPSASASQAAERMKRRSLDYVKRKIQDTPWEVLDSTLLCPGTETACPM